MQSPFIKTLPERCRQIRAHVSPDVDVFHFLALAFSSEIKDVEVFEVSPKVISKIDTFYRVAALNILSLKEIRTLCPCALYAIILTCER